MDGQQHPRSHERSPLPARGVAARFDLAEILDSLANSPDMGIALEAIRNPNTAPATLERVYRTKSYPDYFFQALAAHHHTPPNVMRELYARPATIMGLDIWFAGNPATPREILDKFSRTSTDRSVITSLLGNPALDCALLGQVGVNLMRVQHLDADDRERDARERTAADGMSAEIAALVVRGSDQARCAARRGYPAPTPAIVVLRHDA